MTKAEEKRLEELLAKKKEEKKVEKSYYRWADDHREELEKRWAKQDKKKAEAKESE